MAHRSRISWECGYADALEDIGPLSDSPEYLDGWDAGWEDKEGIFANSDYEDTNDD